VRDPRLARGRCACRTKRQHSAAVRRSAKPYPRILDPARRFACAARRDELRAAFTLRIRPPSARKQRSTEPGATVPTRAEARSCHSHCVVRRPRPAEAGRVSERRDEPDSPSRCAEARPSWLDRARAAAARRSPKRRPARVCHLLASYRERRSVRAVSPAGVTSPGGLQGVEQAAESVPDPRRVTVASRPSLSWSCAPPGCALADIDDVLRPVGLPSRGNLTSARRAPQAASTELPHRQLSWALSHGCPRASVHRLSRV
jgi:hypothetical protein